MLLLWFMSYFASFFALVALPQLFLIRGIARFVRTRQVRSTLWVWVGLELATLGFSFSLSYFNEQLSGDWGSGILHMACLSIAAFLSIKLFLETQAARRTLLLAGLAIHLLLLQPLCSIFLLKIYSGDSLAFAHVFFLYWISTVGTLVFLHFKTPSNPP